MSTIDDLLARIPMDQVARQLGVSRDEAEDLTRQALPALVGGMQANARDPRGAASLAQALGQHDDDLLEGGVDLDQVDTEDGQKIVQHVFGDNRDQIVNRLGGGGKDSMLTKLLPMLAPLVMSFLAKRFTAGAKNRAVSGSSASASAKAGADAGDGPLGGLGGLGGLGDLLGGLLGGGSKGGGIGDLLGDLLGGGRR